jgi:hypothetical protein
MDDHHFNHITKLRGKKRKENKNKTSMYISKLYFKLGIVSKI